jgi:hypothetical protein
MSDSSKSVYEEPVFSRKVIEMLTVANEYCLYVEKAEEYKKEDILEYLQKLLPLIYLKVSLLPDVEVTDESAAEHFVTEEQWENVYTTLSTKLGNQDLFYIAPRDLELQPIKASLAENLADIYQDMKDFVLLYQKPLKVAQENAVHDCKTLFETRTGFRLVAAMQAIHWVIYPERDTEAFSELDLF